MTKLLVAFRNFANAPNNGYYINRCLEAPWTDLNHDRLRRPNCLLRGCQMPIESITYLSYLNGGIVHGFDVRWVAGRMNGWYYRHLFSSWTEYSRAADVISCSAVMQLEWFPL